ILKSSNPSFFSKNAEKSGTTGASGAKTRLSCRNRDFTQPLSICCRSQHYAAGFRLNPLVQQ
ncbi:hypothetical protein, partial [Phascolarctobacterium succinatutens]|uniref:hypothetical protein n=1 Tax=Phascolarctobacterium succinatutens TaxID=626940 RepID=UPI0040281005